MTAVAEDISELADKAARVARREEAAYARGAERPLGGYAVLLSIYAVLTAGLAALARRRGSRWQPSAGDLTQLGIATHKLSRLVTKDTVTAVARAPFTTFKEPAGDGEVNEDVRGSGLRHAVGELVTCPFCIAVWVATALAFGLLLAPRVTRIVLAVLCAVASSDYLQLTYAILQHASTDD
jgi:hypothetical protein